MHPSTNPRARTTIAPPGMSYELLPGIFMLEVLQVNECECEYDEAGFMLYQCEICYQAEEDARCSCRQDHINPNCEECY